MTHPTNYKFSVNGQLFSTSDPQISGRDIRSSAGLRPASNFVLIEVGNGTSRSVGLEEAIKLAPPVAPYFLAFESDRTFSFTVNERGFEWGIGEISAEDLRRYASIPDDQDMFLDSDADAPIEDDDVVHLGRKGVERIITKERPKIRIIVNTREKFVDSRVLTFEALVKLAFPDLPMTPNTAFTVSYRKGPDKHPEGTLIEGESVRIKKGEVFNVSATDKS
jgi:hypothetical protein